MTRNKHIRDLTVLFFTFIGMASVLHADSRPDEPTVRVQAEGEVKAVPDEVTLSFAIQTEDKDVKKAKENNDDVYKNVMKVLTKFKIDKKDIQVGQIRISPEYIYQSRKRIFDRYRVDKSLHVTVRDLDQFGSLVQGLIDGGVDQVSNISYGVSDEEKLKKEARVLAMKNAQAKAQALAGAIGQSIGKAVSIEEFNTVRPIMPYQRAMSLKASADMEADAGVPIEPGEFAVQTNVTVAFQLK